MIPEEGTAPIEIDIYRFNDTFMRDWLSSDYYEYWNNFLTYGTNEVFADLKLNRFNNFIFENKFQKKEYFKLVVLMLPLVCFTIVGFYAHQITVAVEQV